MGNKRGPCARWHAQPGGREADADSPSQSSEHCLASLGGSEGGQRAEEGSAVGSPGSEGEGELLCDEAASVFQDQEFWRHM